MLCGCSNSKYKTLNTVTLCALVYLKSKKQNKKTWNTVYFFLPQGSSNRRSTQPESRDWPFPCCLLSAGSGRTSAGSASRRPRWALASRTSTWTRMSSRTVAWNITETCQTPTYPHNPYHANITTAYVLVCKYNAHNITITSSTNPTHNSYTFNTVPLNQAMRKIFPCYAPNKYSKACWMWCKQGLLSKYL